MKIFFKGKIYSRVVVLPISSCLKGRVDHLGWRGRLCGGVGLRERKGLDGQTAAFYYQAR